MSQQSFKIILDIVSGPSSSEVAQKTTSTHSLLSFQTKEGLQIDVSSSVEDIYFIEAMMQSRGHIPKSGMSISMSYDLITQQGFATITASSEQHMRSFFESLKKIKK